MSYPERLASKIVETLNTAAKDHLRGQWTTELLKMLLCGVGKQEGLVVCASGCEGADHGEWLYDMSWLDYGGKDAEYGLANPEPGKGLYRDQVLALESEWRGTDGELESDFEKLVQARSALRVMVFPVRQERDAESTIRRLFLRDIKAFRRGQADDTYLFCAWIDQVSTVEFRHWVIRNTPPWALTPLP